VNQFTLALNEPREPTPKWGLSQLSKSSVTSAVWALMGALPQLCPALVGGAFYYRRQLLANAAIAAPRVASALSFGDHDLVFVVDRHIDLDLEPSRSVVRRYRCTPPKAKEVDGRSASQWEEGVLRVYV
jgi:hypothetical protein